MTSLEESVVHAMDGTSKALFPFLPYIVQDLWRIGSSPEVINRLVAEHSKNHSELRVLDLGCGKGIISVNLARKFNCSCLGIDGVKEFIGVARSKAKEWAVDHLCQFETDDIRTRIKKLNGYDVIILASVGPVFGDYNSTLSSLSSHLNDGGIIIIDDGYIDDASEFSHPHIMKKGMLLQQIAGCGMEMSAEIITDCEEIKNSDKVIFDKIVKRGNQLIEMYPENSEMFLEFIIKQQEENELLEKRKVICSAMVLKKPVK